MCAVGGDGLGRASRDRRSGRSLGGPRASSSLSCSALSSSSPPLRQLIRFVPLQVICDKTADPALVASDLLGQQEHGLDSQSVLVTIDCDDSYVEAVNAAVAEQAQALPRAEILRKSLSQSFILQTKSVDEAFAFSNDYAPEHLLLYIEDAAKSIELVENAGSVFVGPWSPVACVLAPLSLPLSAALAADTSRSPPAQMRRLRLRHQPHPACVDFPFLFLRSFLELTRPPLSLFLLLASQPRSATPSSTPASRPRPSSSTSPRRSCRRQGSRTSGPTSRSSPTSSSSARTRRASRSGSTRLLARACRLSRG